MSNKKITVKFGSLSTLLTVLFVGLKLTGFITWSWWWVVAPLWIPLAIFEIIMIAILIFMLIAALVTSR